MGQGGKQAKTNVFANLKYIFGVVRQIVKNGDGESKSLWKLN